jgi:hypothetical protein
MFIVPCRCGVILCPYYYGYGFQVGRGRWVVSCVVCGVVWWSRWGQGRWWMRRDEAGDKEIDIEAGNDAEKQC